MPQQDKATPLEADVDNLLDKLREQVLAANPPNVPDYLAKCIKKFQTGEAVLETCERIVPKYSPALTERALTVVVLGASGDLAKKKTFPALFQLYCSGLLPPHVNIIGYARSEIADVEKWKKEVLAAHFTRLNNLGCHVASFLKLVSYEHGAYDKVEDFKRLDAVIRAKEATYQGKAPGGNRLFYLALPPTVFVAACTSIRHGAMVASEGGWVHVVIEKPFGRDTESSAELSRQLEPLFDESQIFRIDHYLGKEMVQNIITMRFANRIFSAIWDCNSISNIQITFKEKIGTEGRGGYFDNYGIIRDVIQNHLTQILALVGMEKPRSLAAEHIRDEKVAVLRLIAPVTLADCVLGQYTASPDGKVPGYLDDPTVKKGSRTPTFAMVRLFIDSDRWAGVPFILKAGKAVDDNHVSIRIQFKDERQPYGKATTRNELVIRAQPDEAMYLKVTSKNPGLSHDLTDTLNTELDLTYRHRYDVRLPDAYESLIYEAITGNSTNFVRKDELDAAWRIFTPLLHEIESGELQPIPYAAGSRGPEESDKLVADSGYKRTLRYNWSSGSL